MELLLSPRSLKNWLSPEQDKNQKATDEKHQLARLSRQYRLESYEQLKIWDKKRAFDLTKHRQKLEKKYDDSRHKKQEAQQFRRVVVQFLEQLIRQKEGYMKMQQSDNPTLVKNIQKHQTQLQELKRHFFLFRQHTTSQLERLNIMEQIDNKKQQLTGANKEASETCQHVSMTFQTNRQANKARDCPKDTYVVLLKLMSIARKQHILQVKLQQLINNYEQIVRKEVYAQRQTIENLLLACRQILSTKNQQLGKTFEQPTVDSHTFQPSLLFQPFPSLHLFILHKSSAEYCFEQQYRPVMIILTIDGFMHVANWHSSDSKPQFTFKLNSLVQYHLEGMEDLKIICRQTSLFGMISNKSKKLFELYFRFKETAERNQLVNSLRMLLP